MSTYSNQGQQPLDTLASILSDIEGTLRQTYGIVHHDEDSEDPSPKELRALLRRLHYEIKAAHAFSCSLEDTSTGWPDVSSKVMSYTGPRSGYPIDLVSGILSKAEGLTKMVRLSLEYSPEFMVNKLIMDGSANTALWGIHGLILEVKAVINYKQVGDEKRAEAA